MIQPVFIIPILVGVATTVLSFVLFKRNSISARYFAIALLLSVAMALSPGIFYLLGLVKGVFGIQFTFVIAFGVVNIVVLVMLVYLLLIIGKLRNEITTLWQETALLKSELEDSERP
jgi:hypothetical protein